MEGMEAEAEELEVEADALEDPAAAVGELEGERVEEPSQVLETLVDYPEGHKRECRMPPAKEPSLGRLYKRRAPKRRDFWTLRLPTACSRGFEDWTVRSWRDLLPLAHFPQALRSEQQRG